MAIEVTPLGYQKPDGNELMKSVDEIISANSQLSQDLLGQALPDIEALKTVAGLQPGDVSDATMASVANDPASQFRGVLDGSYATKNNPAFTGTPTGITKAHIGLGSADNTSDLDKPVSLAAQAELDRRPADANRLLGQHIHGPAAVDNIQITSTTATYIGGSAAGIANYSVDFVVPASGRVRFTADAYVQISSAVNEYAGMGVAIGGVVPEASKKFMLRRGPTSGEIHEGRVHYTYDLTDLEPGASYTATLVAYINGTGSYYIISGGAFGSTTITAEALAAPVTPFGTTSTVATAPKVLVSDGKYNSFPGVVKCFNGDLLAMYRDGTDHTTGTGGVQAIRSTDNGATWGAPTTGVSVAGKELGTATLSRVGANTIALTTWQRTSGALPDVNATRLYLSTNNGTSWSSPYTVAMPAGFLGKYSVSESALTLHEGYYYLAVWGEPAGSAASSYQAGIIRSTDLATWSLVCDFGLGWNECGVTVIGGKLVGFARKETGMILSTTISTNGTTWSPLSAARADGVAAPKFATLGPGGLAYNPLRIGSPGGRAYLAAADAEGDVGRIAHIALDNAFMYGQAVETTAGRVGVLLAAEASSTDSRIYWAEYNITFA